MTTTTDLPPAEPAAPPPLDGVGFLRWCWRQLTSMRVALILLFLLAIAAIPGSVLPQRGTDPIRVNEWIEGNPTWGPILDRLGFFDVYAAPWFAAVYLLLFVSVIGCVLPRTRLHWRALRSAPPDAPRRLDRMPEHRTWTSDLTQSEVLDRAYADLSRRRWRVARGDGWISAEKGYWRETGNLLFHAALIALLIAVGYGALFGWRGNVIVREGSGFSDTLTQYDAWGGGRLVDPAELPPFAFTLEDFRVEFERGEAQRGAPRLFEADLTLWPEPGAPAEAVMVRVNEPLSVDGAKVFLVGHGYAPELRLTDALGRVVHDEGVVFLPQDGNMTSTGVLKSPDATPSIGIEGLFLPTAAVDDVRGPHSTFPEADDPAVFLPEHLPPRHRGNDAARYRGVAAWSGLGSPRRQRHGRIRRPHPMGVLPDRSRPGQGAGADLRDRRSGRIDDVAVHPAPPRLGPHNLRRPGDYRGHGGGSGSKR